MNIFKEVADIKTADMLNLPTPEVEYHNIVSEPTEFQKSMVKELSKRAEKVHAGIDPHIDNMRERYVTAINHEENVTKAVAGVQ